MCTLVGTRRHICAAHSHSLQRGRERGGWGAGGAIPDLVAGSGSEQVRLAFGELSKCEPPLQTLRGEAGHAHCCVAYASGCIRIRWSASACDGLLCERGTPFPRIAGAHRPGGTSRPPATLTLLRPGVIAPAPVASILGLPAATPPTGIPVTSYSVIAARQRRQAWS